MVEENSDKQIDHSIIMSDWTSMWIARILMVVIFTPFILLFLVIILDVLDNVISVKPNSTYLEYPFSLIFIIQIIILMALLIVLYYVNSIDRKIDDLTRSVHSIQERSERHSEDKESKNYGLKED